MRTMYFPNETGTTFADLYDAVAEAGAALLEACLRLALAEGRVEATEANAWALTVPPRDARALSSYLAQDRANPETVTPAASPPIAGRPHTRHRPATGWSNNVPPPA